ncbi:hypothetical protein EG328_000641 [Venturia inaequalis]|uniref:Uncharacterized protein n=1 Tax=Venturia inaequalis TaxID=5025 RepID=A0A8H3Z1M7_VENIN|nr:hypothetical protein EG328_000641 [Venturia inaequalis]
MTTFLTLPTPRGQTVNTNTNIPAVAADAAAVVVSQGVLVPRQTEVSDSTATASSSSSSSPASSSSSSDSENPQTATTTTTAPILRTIDGVVYFRTSMPALDVIGIPVTTLIQGTPERPIAVWNATQAHGYEVSGIVGQWAALGVLSGFGLLFLVLFLSESVGFLRRKIRGSSSSSDDDDEFIDTKKKHGMGNAKAMDIPLSDSAIPLTDRTRRSSANVSTSRGRSPHSSMGGGAGGGMGTGGGIGGRTAEADADKRARRLSTYTSLPLSNLDNAEPYDVPGFEGSGAERRASRYYGDGEGGGQGLPGVGR